ncbi:MAG: (deoxy)nucleoside triphosphate pyrophosphohydrolase [Spirosomataceae bacterium]
MVVVPCAILENEGQIFTAQRNVDMSLPLKWEFPGGKVDEGENEVEALRREIMEELSVEIEVGARLTPTFKEDPHRDRVICLVPYICHLVSSPIVLTEHLQYKWIRLEDIFTLDWAEADLGVIETYLHYSASKKLRRRKPRVSA